MVWWRRRGGASRAMLALIVAGVLGPAAGALAQQPEARPPAPFGEMLEARADGNQAATEAQSRIDELSDQSSALLAR